MNAYKYLVLVTSHGSRDHVLAGLSVGGDDDVSKPLDPLVLHTRLLAAHRVTTLHAELADALDEATSTKQRLADFTGRVGDGHPNPPTSILGQVERSANLFWINETAAGTGRLLDTEEISIRPYRCGQRRGADRECELTCLRSLYRFAWDGSASVGRALIQH